MRGGSFSGEKHNSAEKAFDDSQVRRHRRNLLFLGAGLLCFFIVLGWMHLRGHGRRHPERCGCSYGGTMWGIASGDPFVNRRIPGMQPAFRLGGRYALPPLARVGQYVTIVFDKNAAVELIKRSDPSYDTTDHLHALATPFSAEVTQVNANGLLHIAAEWIVSINGENKMMRLTATLDPADIGYNTESTVSASKLMNMKVIFDDGRIPWLGHGAYARTRLRERSQYSYETPRV